MKNTGKPYEGELHVRFDEKAEENMKSNPPLYSTWYWNCLLSRDILLEICILKPYVILLWQCLFEYLYHCRLKEKKIIKYKKMSL